MEVQVTHPQILNYVIANSSPQPAVLDEIMAYTATHFPKGVPMLTGPLEGRFLYFLVKMTKAQRVLELGTFTGSSALSMAEALPENGHLITCDKDERVVAVAKSFAKRVPYGDKIEFRIGHCLDILATLENQQFDFIFIDADKMPYPEYIKQCLRLLAPGGLIAVDNTLWETEVLAPHTDHANMFVELNKQLASDPQLFTLLLPIRDGITLIQKI